MNLITDIFIYNKFLKEVVSSDNIFYKYFDNK
jgi:hypothetical protein